VPRQPRLDSPGLVHHVMARGIEGQGKKRDASHIYDSGTEVPKYDSLFSRYAMPISEVYKFNQKYLDKN